MTDWNGSRPNITDGKVGVGDFGVAVAPDGDKLNARVVIAPDGFRLTPSDFSDLELPFLKLQSPNGNNYTLSFSDDGNLLINDINPFENYSMDIEEHAGRLTNIEKAIDELKKNKQDKDSNNGGH